MNDTLKIKPRGNKLYAVGSINGKRVRVSTGFSVGQELKAAAKVSDMLYKAEQRRRDKALGIRTITVKGPVTLREACENYLQRPQGVSGTQRQLVDALSLEYGHVRMDVLGVAELHEFSRGKNRKAASTVRRRLSACEAVLNYAETHGIWERPQGFKIVKPPEGEGRLRWLTDEEREIFLSHCSEDLRPLATFLFFTGARLNEAIALNWSDVMKDSVLLRTRKTKGGVIKTRSVPIHPRVRPYIAATTATPQQHVLSCRTGARWYKQEVYREWRKACAASGIRDFNPHDCRHTFASRLVQESVDMKTVAGLLGHGSTRMVERYAHLSPSKLVDAVSLL